MSAGEDKSGVFFRPPAVIAAVDDSQLNRSFIVNAFTPPNYTTLQAEDGESGIELIKKTRPELVLLDVMMPGMDGFQTAEALKNDPETAEIPIIFITALDAVKDKLKAFECGAVDFVTKPFNHRELEARVKTNIELRRMVERNRKTLMIAMEEKRGSAISRIAAGISHNFNNMLGVCAGNIMLIESLAGDKLDGMCSDALKDVRKSLERMQSLVRQFLVIADRNSAGGGPAPEAQSVSLRGLAADVIENITASREKKNGSAPVKIENLVPGDLALYCDGAQLSEILSLILNEAAETSGGKASAEIGGGADAGGSGHCSVSIRNIPLPDNMESSVFEPFALPIANVGSGLAFAVAKHLAEAGGGSARALFPEKNRVDFIITFPAPPFNGVDPAKKYPGEGL
jgi:CheY-like chemotaxis protein